MYMKWEAPPTTGSVPSDKGVTMSILRTIRTAVIVTFLILGLNALWYAVVMRGFYDRPSGSWVSVSRDEPSIVLIAASFFALALLLTLAYPHVRFGRSRWSTGLALGIIVGLFYILPTSLYYLGTTDILAADVMVMDVGWHIIEEGVAGLAVAGLAGVDVSRTARELEEVAA